MAAYGATFTIALHNAAFAADPGDRLAVVFPRGTAVDTALVTLGEAGTLLSGTGGLPWFYQVEVLDREAAARLSENAWVMRIPGDPEYTGCYTVPLPDGYPAKP